MICRSSTNGDLTEIASCHIKAFPRSLSSKLGLKYATRMISFYLEDERGLLFHIEDEKGIQGYCGGLMNKVPGLHGSATSMTQHTFRLLVISILARPWLIFHHEIWANIPLIIKNLKLKLANGNTKKAQSPTIRSKEFTPTMGLVVIGVSPEHQGKGYGSLLLKEFESRARMKGFGKIHLSVHKDNTQAIKSYKKNGWIVEKEGLFDLQMFKDLDWNIIPH